MSSIDRSSHFPGALVTFPNESQTTLKQKTLHNSYWNFPMPIVCCVLSVNTLSLCLISIERPKKINNDALCRGMFIIEGETQRSHTQRAHQPKCGIMMTTGRARNQHDEHTHALLGLRAGSPASERVKIALKTHRTAIQC